MIRRHLLQMIMGLPMTGDGLARPLNAPPASTPPVGVQPGVQQQVVTANRVIIFGAKGGLFVYSGPPAPNNLIFSIASAAGTDLAGNVYLPGSVNYALTGTGKYMAVQTFGAAIAVWTAASMTSGLWTTLNNSAIGFGQNSSPMQFTGPVASTSGTAVNPTVITTDTWHPLGLINGWASVTSPSYTLFPDRTVMVAGVISSAGAAGNPVFANLPAGPPNYRPVTQQETAAGLHGAAPAGGAFMRAATNGDLSVPGSTAVTGPWSVNWRFSLDYA